VTEPQARKVVLLWHEYRKNEGLADNDEDGLRLTFSGELHRDEIIKYSYDQGRRAVHKSKSIDFATFHTVTDWLKKNCGFTQSTQAPEAWLTWGHGAIIELDRTPVEYGIVDIECVCPVMHVLQAREGIDGSPKPPEWTVLSTLNFTKYAGMASPVSSHKADQLKAEWQEKEENGGFYSWSPISLFRKPPKEIVVPGSAIGTVPRAGDLF